MTRGSLRLRLLLGGGIVVLVALAVAALGLTILFERHVTRRVEAELLDHMRELAANVAVATDGTITLVDGPVDPAFDVPLGGFYWQVGDDAGHMLRSRSLWDAVIAVPGGEGDAAALRRYRLPGPNGARLIAVARDIRAGEGDAARWLHLVVAVDETEVAEATADFLRDLVPALALLATVLLVAGWLQVRIGLGPIADIGRRVAAVRSGAKSRLLDDVPDEVVPLVREVNALLEARDTTIREARGRAADLAHGLRTPLAALAADARRLREKGEAALADDIEELGNTMYRHVERELARARIRGRAGGGVELTSLAGLLERLVATLKRTPVGERVTFDLDVPASLGVPVDREDLAEVFGNLLDNAARFAAGCITVTVDRSDPASLRLTVADDGPGIAEADRVRVLERGGRLDTGGGAGLGLAIVIDVLAAYGGRLELGTADTGGLAATVVLPRA
ncbi:MAG: HAMP domain-containing sensor histidine kinase [Hyphomicrobiales bacterium]